MGCFRIVTNQDIQQLRQARNIVRVSGWKPVASDKRYEEKVILYKSRRITRLTRPIGQIPNPDNPEYPHTTEMFNSEGKKDHGKNSRLWDSHYSENEKDHDHPRHKTAQSTLDDLDEAIKSIG